MKDGAEFYQSAGSAAKEGFVRVIGGEYRGRKLRAPAGLTTRPTADRVREALFSIIAARVEGARFLDGYAGTGAVGIEALSRGARRCVFIESDRAAARILEENVASVAAGDRARIITSPFSTTVRALAAEEGAFDLVFLDPPFGAGEILRALRLVATGSLLAPAGLVVAQHDSMLELPAAEGPIERRRSCRYGSSRLSFFSRSEPGGPEKIDTSPPPL